MIDLKTISVAIVEDDEEIRDTLKGYLSSQDDLSFSGGFNSVEKFLDFLKASPAPEVLIIDLGLPGMSGIDGIKILKERYSSMDIVVFSVYNDPRKIFDSLCSGATGYLLKNTPLHEIHEGITMLASGGSPMSPPIARQVIDFLGKDFRMPKPPSVLSEREKEIVVGLVDGLSYKLIADRMNISIETVRFHIKNIYRKLHVHCRSEVISRSLRGEI